jgi:hypothetical protein
MFKTLEEYIKHVEQAIQRENKPEPSLDNSKDQYPVYPESRGEEDRPQNPYSQV